MLVLLGELAATVRAVPVARLLRRVAGVVAVPALRRRLVEASTATAITVSAMSATAGGGVLAASPAVEQTVDVDVVVGCGGGAAGGCDGGGRRRVRLTTATRGAGRGDGETVRVVVASGDTVWDLAVAHYGFCDQSVVDLVAAASGLEIRT